MIPDFIMVFGAYGLMAIIGGIIIPLVNEKLYNSKLLTLGILFLLILYGSLIIHTHNCKNEYVKECEKSHKLAMGYNYCLNQSYNIDNSEEYNSVCLYDLKKKCNLIPDGCPRNKALEVIDGYCFLPYICFLFNSP